MAVEAGQVEVLVERSADLKARLLDYARHPRFDRYTRQALRERFGDVVVGKEEDLVNFFDWFILQYRFTDGATLVDRFLKAHPGIPRHERDFMSGWKDVVDGVFEVESRDGAVLCTVGVVDDLPYRIRTNAGGQIFDRMPPGSFLITRVVPVGEDWLLSGSTQTMPAESADLVLSAAAQMATAAPHAVFRNPEHLARGWEQHRAERAAFIEFFGADLVVLTTAEASTRMREYFRHRNQRLVKDPEDLAHAQEFIPDFGLDELPEDVETVAVIYDEFDGLSITFDFALAEAAFADPALLDRRRHREVVTGLLQDEDCTLIPLQRLAQRDAQKADQVFQRITGRRAFSWQKDGEALLRKYKPGLVDREPAPCVTVIGDRLAAHLRAQ